MPADLEQLRRHLHAFDFPRLLVEELGWNRYPARPVSVQVHGATYTLEPAAEKAGFVVYVCGPDPDGGVPPYPVRRKIERQAARVAYEHMVIFVDSQRTMQVWQWVKREGGKPAACREQECRKDQRGDALVQRLQRLAFELAEEERLGISVVAARVQQALDAEKVTRRFYERFKEELETFRSFIQGIAVQGDREWYASLMLNRMMFVYFIQKQRFLDGDPDYLRNRLRMVQERTGKGRFQQFYRLFLLRLFHEGLGQPEARRAPDLADLLGKVPYLNGGLFDVHDLERDNPDIQIPDEAFEKIFDFFDGYRWHLDERPHRAENEINPDVLGYIFEKYVNQKQMGAYYTREDITGYIARNTAVPFLFDAARKECPVAFAPGGGVWRLLKDDPDRYIYPAVAHGVTWDARQQPPTRLERPGDLPEEIAAGIGDVAKRGDWNRPAPEQFALPTETWREVVARRQRHQEVRAKLASDEVQDVNDLITLNLDVCQFAEDVIVQSEGPELLRAFWHALRDVSVLDPTCGSGAFLFAALNILEPLYTACLEGMRGFLDDLQWSQRPHHPDTMRDFRAVLDQVDKHPNRRYYVLKSIVINNLYGVDIMEEAVEICKLRLFLKLVAQIEGYKQIEPLPDIDFNIRPGNTLVGFATYDDVKRAVTSKLDFDNAMEKIAVRAADLQQTFDAFRQRQVEGDSSVPTEDKLVLRQRLKALDNELSRYLAGEYGIEPKNATAYEKWQASHQPFHWFVEFYGIMHRGGFDVVIGNPPYVEYSRVKSSYEVRGYSTQGCGNLYAFTMERSLRMLQKHSTFGMIVPLSLVATERMSSLQSLFAGEGRSIWLNLFDVYPCKLFEGSKQRLAITLASSDRKSTSVWTTKYNRWKPEERPTLLQLTSYWRSYWDRDRCVIPKVHREVAGQLLRKVSLMPKEVYGDDSDRVSFFVHRIPYNYIKAVDFTPYFWNEADGQKKSEDYKPYILQQPSIARVMLAVLNSNLFFWWWYTLFEGYHCGRHEIYSFPVGTTQMPGDRRAALEALADELMRDIRSNSRRKNAEYRKTGRVAYEEFYPRLSKPIIDRIDRVLAKHYGFTDEELDFIINYDIKYRMGRENEGEDD